MLQITQRAHHIWDLQYLSDWSEISIKLLLQTYTQTDPGDMISIGNQTN